MKFHRLKRSNILGIVLDDRCNQKCAFCIRKIKNTLSTEEAKDYIKNAYSKGYECVSFSGGEPLLRADLPELVGYAKSLGFPRVGLVSNGSLFKEDLIKNLNSKGLSHVIISFHAHTPELYKKITGSNNFYRTRDNIKLLLKNNIKVRLNIVICKFNYKHLEEYVKYIKKEFNGIFCLAFLYVFPRGKAEDSPELVPQFLKVKPYLNRAVDLALELNMRPTITNTPFCFINKKFYIYNVNPPVKLEIGKKQEEKQFAKDEACNSCKLNNLCCGFIKEYISYFGMDKVKPIKKIDKGLLCKLNTKYENLIKFKN